MNTQTVFVHEFICGGGCWTLPGSPTPSGCMLAEGQGMLNAVTHDLVAAGYDVKTTVDQRLADGNGLPQSVEVRHIDSALSLRAAFSGLLSQSPLAIVIAPETDGILTRLCRHFRSYATRLMASDGQFIAMTSNKHKTAAWLKEKGFLAASGTIIPDGPGPSRPRPTVPAQFPVVVKPVDGAGCERTYVVDGVDGWEALPWDGAPYRVERWIQGTAASVAMLVGPQHSIPLAPCLQHLEVHDGRLRYCGGTVLTSGETHDRILELAQRMAPHLSAAGAAGYVGIDLVLAQDSDGRRDVVIEINPRLTTSYVGLRVACRQNLADALLRVCKGQETAIEFSGPPIRFSADGSILDTNPELVA